MRQHGITDFPDPQTGNGGVVFGSGNGGPPPFDPESAEFKSAQAACGTILGIKGHVETKQGPGPSGSSGGG
jgi:hypothetical protein